MATRQMNAAVGQIRRLLTAREVSQLTDQQLLQRFVATREEAAFAALVERHGPMVLGVCRAVLGHAQDAEDACQATFLVLARQARSIRKPASLAHWLHGVACRLAKRARIDRGRSCDRRTDGRQPPNPMDELTGRELRQILHEELARLPESYRLPLILCYLEGQTQDEAARRLGWTAATLKGRVDRGRDLLRRRLLRRGLAPGLPLLLASLSEGPATAAVASRTARAAAHYLAGGVAEGDFGRAVALAEGWERTVLTLKLKAGAALVLMVGILGAGAGLAAYQVPEAGPTGATPGNERRARPDGPRQDQAGARRESVDGRGDALPEGALLRFGSARLRHGGAIRASALAPDGKTLATTGARSVIIWDLDTGKALHRLGWEHGTTFCGPGLAFSSDGTRLGFVRNDFFVHVWDLRTGKELRRLERRFEDGVNRFWSAHCRFANGAKELVVISREAIETWDVESGRQTASLPVGRTRLLSPDGTTYLCNVGNALVLGDTTTGKERRRLDVTARHDGIENGLAFSPDGTTLAVVHEQKEIQLREAGEGRVLTSFPLPGSARQPVSGGQQHWEYRVAFSTDGKTLLLGTAGGLIHRWDVVTGRELPPLSKHLCAVAGMHTLPDGRTLVSTGADGVIRRWDLKIGRHDAEPESYEGPSTAAYAPDGRLAAIGDARGRLDLWDGRTGRRIRTVQNEGNPVTHLAFAPDGRLLAAAERSGTVRFWQVPSGQPGAAWRREPERGEWYCNGITFSPDGRLLCVSDYPKRHRVVEVATGKRLWAGECSYAEVFAPDSATLLVAAPSGSSLTRLQATTGNKRATVRFDTRIPDGLGVTHALAFSPDGRRLVVADSSGTLMLCDGQTLAELQRLADHDPRDAELRELTGDKMPNRVRTIAFSPDGKWFASAGSDAAVYLWETATGQEVLRLHGHEAEVSSVAFSPDGRSVFSYGQDGQGYLWALRPKRAAGPPATLNKLWADLAEAKAATAYRAVWALSEDPRAPEFLRKNLPPAVPPGRAHLAKLIADLDSNRFEVRDGASRALAELAELAAPALEEALQATPPLEQRKRLEGLLASLKGGPAPAQILRTRAVQVLELADTADARQVLREWARGSPAARLTQEARAALARLERHKR